MMSSHARPERDGGGDGGFRPTGRQVAAVLVAVVLVVFIAANRTEVRVNFVFFDVETSMWLVLAGTALLGVIVGMALGARRTKRKYMGD